MVSRDGTAINHINYVAQDYGSFNLNISFAPGETIRTHPVYALEDTNEEGEEYYFLDISSNDANVEIIKGSGRVTILDESLKPTYLINLATSSFDEGGYFRANVSTTGVDAGTYIYWTLSGTDIDANDFSSGVLEDSGRVKADGTLAIAHTLAADNKTEGAESFIIKLYTDLNRTNLVATSPIVTISDTSTTPLPTYSIASSPSTVKEGGSLTTTVETTDVASGTKLYWAISGSNVKIMTSQPVPFQAPVL